MEYTNLGNMWWALTCNVFVCIAALGFMMLLCDRKQQ